MAIERNRQVCDLLECAYAFHIFRLSTSGPTATGLLDLASHVADKLVQLSFERAQLILFGSEQLFGVDLCRLTLLFHVSRYFQVRFDVTDPILQVLLSLRIVICADCILQSLNLGRQFLALDLNVQKLGACLIELDRCSLNRSLLHLRTGEQNLARLNSCQ